MSDEENIMLFCGKHNGQVTNSTNWRFRVEYSGTKLYKGWWC